MARTTGASRVGQGRMRTQRQRGFDAQRRIADKMGQSAYTSMGGDNAPGFPGSAGYRQKTRRRKKK